MILNKPKNYMERILDKTIEEILYNKANNINDDYSEIINDNFSSKKLKSFLIEYTNRLMEEYLANEIRNIMDECVDVGYTEDDYISIINKLIIK
jgi:hypothetical protein